VDDLEPVGGFGARVAVLAAGHDFPVAFDGDGAFGQAEVDEQLGEREPRRDGGGLAVDLHGQGREGFGRGRPGGVRFVGSHADDHRSSAKLVFREPGPVRLGGLLMNRRRILLCGAAGGLCALVVSVAVATGGVVRARVGGSSLALGVTIDGRRPAGDEGIGPWLETRRGQLGGEELALFHEGKWWFPTRAELGVELDVAATLEAAARATHAPGPLVALRRALAHDTPLDVPLVFRVDAARARDKLATLAPDVRREPINARLDLGSRTTVPDSPGAELDVDKTLDEIVTRKDNLRGGDVVSLVTRPITPAITTADLGNIDLSKILSAQETTFTLWGSGYNRMINIRTAAAKLDGVVLGPGEMLSFNQAVGERTLEAGFALAPEIVDDELQDGVGGGTCQVASTLHAATLFGALEIVERQSHSRPSSYIQPGLDATVAWGKVDLKIRNNRSEPILIHAFLSKPTALRVELLGATPTAKVEYRYGASGYRDFWRRVTQKNHFAPGKVVRKQKGKRGFHATSIVTTTFADGGQTERMYGSEYRPVPEVFWVGPGFDEAELGELPEGVTRVQYRGVRRDPDSGS
jgi:vancomycin resistance protein YoaR